MTRTRPATPQEREIDVAKRAAALEAGLDKGFLSRRQYDEGQEELVTFDGYRRPLHALASVEMEIRDMPRETYRLLIGRNPMKKIYRAGRPRLRKSKALRYGQ